MPTQYFGYTTILFDPICDVIDNYNTSAYYEPSPYIARSYYTGSF